MKVIKTKIIISFIAIIIAIAIVSLTIGRDILQEKNPGLTSFATVHFAGYLFFLLMPVEAAFAYYLIEHNAVTLILIALTTAMLAQLIDYAIGYLMSRSFINHLVGKKRFSRARKLIDKYGNWTIFFFNLFPLSSPIVVLVAGMTRHKLWQVIFYSFLGLTVKYVVIAFIF